MMFRPYTPKNDVQKKSYYTDRFYVTPEAPKRAIEAAPYSDDLAAVSAVCSVQESYVQCERPIVYVAPEDVKKALEALKTTRGYQVLVELSAIDWLSKRGHFELFYELLSITEKKRFRLKCRLPEGVAIETVTDLFKSADWQEREMFDMFGIRANNHPNLKRLLMPADWVGHPLLKTYPLHGDESAQWYEVDLVYGKEYRDVIGPENRDGAYIKEKDTENFGRVGHEVPFGAPYEGEKETPIQYQEENKPFLVQTYDPKKQKTLEKRR